MIMTSHSPPDYRWGVKSHGLKAHNQAASLGLALYGVVLSCVEGQVEGTPMVRIALPDHSLPCSAAIAASCLLQPEVGDRVLLCRGPDISGDDAHVWWILAVLQRGQGGGMAVLQVPGAAELRLQAPSLGLLAEQSLVVRTKEFELTTVRGHVQAGVMQLVASVADVVAQRLTRVAGAFHAVSKSVSEQCRVRATIVEEVDSTKAGVIRLESQQVMRLKSQQVLLDATETMRIDGEQILMG